MKLAFVAPFAIATTAACPHLGYTVAGGENPHIAEAEAELEYGHLRRVKTAPAPRTSRPTPAPRTSRPTPPPHTSAPSPSPRTEPPTPEQGPARFEGTVPEAIASARAEMIAMMEAELSLPSKFVRLGFHDCVGPEGCNGCIDLDNPENAGLLLPMGRLCTLCGFYSSALTRADCWALAALTAVDHTQPDPHVVDFELLHVGRTTCADGNLLGDSASDGAEFPSPHLTSDQLVNYFASEFAFSPDETVAIMGAHTLGTLSNTRSGFDGAWVHGERIFDNEFYRFLVDPQDASLPSNDFVLENINNANGKYTWTHNGGVTGDRPEIMLNADMALVRDFGGYISDTDELGQVSCVLSNNLFGEPVCPTAQTMPKVSEYSQDNTLWVNDFHAVFTKMLINGHDFSHCTEGVLCDLSL